MRGRFTLIVAAVLLLVALAVLGYFPARIETATRRATEERAFGLANAVAIGVAVGLEVLDLSAITAAFEFARSDPDFSAVEVRDQAGQVIGAFGDVTVSAGDSPDFQHVEVPVVYQDRRLGTVALWMDLSRMQEEIRRQRRDGMLLCGAILLVGAVLTTIGSLPITRPLAALAEAATRVAAGDMSTPLPTPRDREVLRLAVAFDDMRHQVQDTLHRLDEQSTEVRTMLDHLEQGVFTFEPDFRVNPQHSRRAPGVLGVEVLGGADARSLFPVDAASIEAFEKWVELMVAKGAGPGLERIARLNPIESFTRTDAAGEHYVRVVCRPIVEDDRVRRFLVLVSDVTEERRTKEALEEKELEQRSDSERVLSLVRNDRREIDDLVASSRHAIDEARLLLDDGRSRPTASLGREVHTLKGNAGSFGFSGLAAAFGELERGFDAAEHLPTALDALEEELEAINEWRRRLFSESSDRIGVSRAGFDRFVHELECGTLTDSARVLARARCLPARPLSDYATRYQRFLESYRTRYGKAIADLVVSTPHLPILPEVMQSVDGSVVQLIRNAADHGIEETDVRRSEGKGPGRITVAARYHQESLEVTVSDDGRGIDVEAVASAALRRGAVDGDVLATMSRAERFQLALMPGVTTRSRPGEVSGRGVGLDAVAQAMRDRGGDVHLESEPGRGSRITLKLPLSGFSTGAIACADLTE